ncbi:MAG: hypothetical protein AAFP04_05530 [Myxococcota bacterium]
MVKGIGSGVGPTERTGGIAPSEGAEAESPTPASSTTIDRFGSNPTPTPAADSGHRGPSLQPAGTTVDRLALAVGRSLAARAQQMGGPLAPMLSLVAAVKDTDVRHVAGIEGVLAGTDVWGSNRPAEFQELVNV